MNQFSAASTMSTYNTVIRCRGNRSKGWGAPGGPMQGPKRFKIIKNDKNLAIVSSFIASILVECWIFCKETVNWWDGTSLKQNDLCRGPSRGLTLLKIARKKKSWKFCHFLASYEFFLQILSSSVLELVNTKMEQWIFCTDTLNHFVAWEQKWMLRTLFKMAKNYQIEISSEYQI